MTGYGTDKNNYVMDGTTSLKNIINGTTSDVLNVFRNTADGELLLWFCARACGCSRGVEAVRLPENYKNVISVLNTICTIVEFGGIQQTNCHFRVAKVGQNIGKNVPLYSRSLC